MGGGDGTALAWAHRGSKHKSSRRAVHQPPRLPIVSAWLVSVLRGWKDHRKEGRKEGRTTLGHKKLSGVPSERFFVYITRLCGNVFFRWAPSRFSICGCGGAFVWSGTGVPLFVCAFASVPWRVTDRILVCFCYPRVAVRVLLCVPPGGQ